MARPILVALTDIRDAIALAQEATGGMTLKAFEAHRVHRAATERALLTISEAVRHLPADVTDRHPNIRWPEIRGLGNRLRHEYWRVDARIVWAVVEDELDALDAAVRSELRRFEIG